MMKFSAKITALVIVFANLVVFAQEVDPQEKAFVAPVTKDLKFQKTSLISANKQYNRKIEYYKMLIDKAREQYIADLEKGIKGLPLDNLDKAIADTEIVRIKTELAGSQKDENDDGKWVVNKPFTVTVKPDQKAIKIMNVEVDDEVYVLGLSGKMTQDAKKVAKTPPTTRVKLQQYAYANDLKMRIRNKDRVSWDTWIDNRWTKELIRKKSPVATVKTVGVLEVGVNYHESWGLDLSRAEGEFKIKILVKRKK